MRKRAVRARTRSTAMRDASLALRLAWAALPALRPLVAHGFPDLNMLQWNPHWQCFAWNTNNCTAESEAHLTSFLEDLDVDFADVIELGDPNYTLPDNFTQIGSLKTCGRDFLSLVYNHIRWEPVSEPAMLSKGCMQLVPPDRPFVIQEFSDTNTAERVIVIAAHFPHPMGFKDVSFRETLVLRDAVTSFLNQTSTRRVILIADTNEFATTSNANIMWHIGVPTKTVVGTRLLPSCCFDNDFYSLTTFDRIIANFGEEMETRMLLDPLPEWAKDIDNETKRKAAFHKAIFGRLLMHSSGRAEAARARIRWIIVGVLALVAAGGAALLSATLAGRRHPQSERLKEVSDTDSD